MKIKLNLKRIRTLSFFYKIFLIYALILLFTITILSIFIAKKVGNETIKNELDNNRQILLKVINLIEQNHDFTSNLVKQFYADAKSNPEIQEFLESSADVTDSKFLNNKQKFYQYMSTKLITDINVNKLIVYKNLDRTIYLFPQTNRTLEYESNFRGFDESFIASIDRNGVTVLPAHTAEYTLYPNLTEKTVYTFAAMLKDTVLLNDLGILMLDFDASNIAYAYKEHANEVIGSIYLIDGNGQIIFDSDGKYYGQTLPFEEVKGVTSGFYTKNDFYINAVPSAIPGITAIGIIPRQQMLERTNSILNTIYLIILLCTLASFIICFVLVKILSKRVEKILTAMKTLKKGNLSVRIPIRRKKDEIDEIAVSFNEMCGSLESYIERVYISETKQMIAELKALQSQVNPHFLYNTLESIRMKAISKGTEDIGEMIYILANLFRSAIKEEMIISIEKEIEFCMTYLELFKVRYQDNLQVRMDIESGILKYGIVKHLIQPAIENYIMHGYQLHNEYNEIHISGRLTENDIIFTCEDNGNGINRKRLLEIQSRLALADSGAEPEKSASMGLLNVNDRIKLIFGKNYGVEIESCEHRGTKVTIKIGKKTVEELREYVQGINCR